MIEYSILHTALFGTNTRPDLEQQVVTAVPVDIERQNNSRIMTNNKYDEDVNALAKHYGGLESKTELCITLQEILSLCPRERRRSDAYVGLISYLNTEYNIKLKIISRKHDKKD